MKDIKYVCSRCGYEAEILGSCPNCQEILAAVCPACDNPVAGEHIHLECQ